MNVNMVYQTYAWTKKKVLKTCCFNYFIHSRNSISFCLFCIYRIPERYFCINPHEVFFADCFQNMSTLINMNDSTIGKDFCCNLNLSNYSYYISGRGEVVCVFLWVLLCCIEFWRLLETTWINPASSLGKIQKWFAIGYFLGLKESEQYKVIQLSLCLRGN